MLPERAPIAAACWFLAVHCLGFIPKSCACRSLQALCLLGRGQGTCTALQGGERIKKYTFEVGAVSKFSVCSLILM